MHVNSDDLHHQLAIDRGILLGPAIYAKHLLVGNDFNSSLEF